MKSILFKSTAISFLALSSITLAKELKPNATINPNPKITLNKLKVRTPASFQQMQLSEGKCAYVPESETVPGDFLVIKPRKAKGFSFCVANAYCKIDNEIRPQRLYCDAEKDLCPKDANVCASDRFAKYNDGTPKK